MPVDIVDEDDQTALMQAVISNRTDAVRCLLEKRVNVDKQNRSDRTALDIASLDNHTDVIRMLLQHRGTRDIKNDDGSKPID